MDNYYEILELSPNASKEIIDKAYKTLAKKYHPDLHPEEKKNWAEQQFKKINQAYNILSDIEKKAIYDNELKIQNFALSKKYEQLHQENLYLKEQLQYFKETSNHIVSTNHVDSTDSMDYNIPEYNYETTQYIKRESTFKLKNIIALILTILVLILILYILLSIPITKNYIYEYLPFINNITIGNGYNWTLLFTL